jgi:hypothetical protein
MYATIGAGAFGEPGIELSVKGDELVEHYRKRAALHRDRAERCRRRIVALDGPIDRMGKDIGKVQQQRRARGPKLGLDQELEPPFDPQAFYPPHVPHGSMPHHPPETYATGGAIDVERLVHQRSHLFQEREQLRHERAELSRYADALEFIAAHLEPDRVYSVTDQFLMRLLGPLGSGPTPIDFVGYDGPESPAPGPAYGVVRPLRRSD